MEGLLQKKGNGIPRMPDKTVQIGVRIIAFAKYQTNAARMKQNVEKHHQKTIQIVHLMKYVYQLNAYVSYYEKNQ